MVFFIVRHEHHHHHHHHHSVEARCEVMRRLDAWRDETGLTLDRTELIMINTSKLLESARKESTENASLRALMTSVRGELATRTAELAAAIAANDPAAIAAAQKDIDDAAALLDADDAETEAALAANVPPAPSA